MIRYRYLINIGKSEKFSNYSLDERLENLRFGCAYGKLFIVSNF